MDHRKVALMSVVIAVTVGALIGSQVMSVLAQPAYTQLNSASKGQDGNSLKLSVNTNGNIPTSPDDFINSVPVFGYAWADLDTGNIVAATIHPVIGRDSTQNPDAWHIHPVTLTAGTKGKVKSDFCIASIGQHLDTAEGGIAITGSAMSVSVSLDKVDVSADDLDAAASFVVQLDDKCSSGLGVVLLSAVGL